MTLERAAASVAGLTIDSSRSDKSESGLCACNQVKDLLSARIELISGYDVQTCCSRVRAQVRRWRQATPVCRPFTWSLAVPSPFASITRAYRQNNYIPADNMADELEELLLETLDDLEWRLRRIEFVLGGNLALQDAGRSDAPVTTRLQKLESSLASLASKSRAVKDVLQLRMILDQLRVGIMFLTARNRVQTSRHFHPGGTTQRAHLVAR